MRHETSPSYRFALYVRKSSESEDRQVLSIESQIEHLQEYAQKNRIFIRKIYEDSASAHKPHNRPQFTQMLKDIQQKEIDGILCWKADRLARNLVEGGQLIHQLQTKCIKTIRTPYQSYFPDSNMMMLTIELGMANQYSLDLSKNIKRGNRTKALKGGWCRVAPIGYLNDRINKTIVKDPERFSYIKKVFKLYETGNYSMADICTIAHEQWQFKTIQRPRSGGAPLSISTIYRILKNPFYAGWICADGVMTKGNHPAMINQHQFDTIQKLLSKKNFNKYKLEHSLGIPYKKIMTCSTCKGAITAHHKTKYKCPKCNKQHCSRHPKKCSCGHIITRETIQKGNHYVYYHCTGKKGKSAVSTKKCKQPYVTQQTIEAQIIEYIQQLTPFCRPFINWVSKSLSTNNKTSNTEREVKKLKEHIKELNRKENALLELAIERMISSDAFKTKKLAIEGERQMSKGKIKQLKSKNTDLNVEKICKRLKTLGKQFKNLSSQKKKQVLQKIGSHWTLDGQKLALDWHPAIKALIDFHMVYKGKIAPLVGRSQSSLKAGKKEASFIWWSKWDELRTHLQNFDLPDFELPDTQQ